MAHRTCSIAECERTHFGRGWCYLHYSRWRLYGDPMTVLRPNGDPEGRFWAKVDKSGDCWEWTAGRYNTGYGQFWTGQEKVSAHRFSYTLAHGDIPDGLQVDHICRNRNCVNPAHLRLATNKENHENLGRAFSDSKSGVRGVSRCKMTGQWIGFVGHNSKHYNVGRFDTIEEARAAVVAKRNELHTHNAIDRGESVA